jgi:hypothetical protein
VLFCWLPLRLFLLSEGRKRERNRNQQEQTGNHVVKMRQTALLMQEANVLIQLPDMITTPASMLRYA